MELMLFVFAIGYLVIVLISVVVALGWSIRRQLGFLKTTGVVLATLLVIYAIPFGDHTLGEIKKYHWRKVPESNSFALGGWLALKRRGGVRGGKDEAGQMVLGL